MKRQIKSLLCALTLVAASLCGCQVAELPVTVDDGADMPVYVFAINVGKADSILVQVGDKHYLIDTGTKKGYADLENALDKLGVTHLDGVFLTHTDKDHGGGMEKLAESDITIDAFYAASIYYEKSEKKHQAIQAAAARDMEVIWLNTGDTVDISDGCRFDVLGPLAVDKTDENNNSLVMKLITPEGTALFAGDMENEAEDRLIASGADLKCNYLKVGHHGRDSATGPAFATLAAPEIAVISTNTVEEPDSPSPGIISLLSSVGAAVYVTQDYELGVGVSLIDGHAVIDNR